MPVVEIEHDRIGWRLGPAMLPNDAGRADHRICFSRPRSFVSGLRPSRA
jgi:hypothetical protein